MMPKRLDLGTTLLAAMLAAAPVGAQSGGKFTLPAPGAVRQGVEARPQQTVLVDPYYRNPSYPLQPAQPVQFILVPAVLMSDGSIFANFGYGYEPVVRSCAVVVSGQTQRVGAGGVTLSQARAIPYTPPAPSQMTASQQMIANGVRLSAPAQLACFTHDAAGRVFVYRRS